MSTTTTPNDNPFKQFKGNRKMFNSILVMDPTKVFAAQGVAELDLVEACGFVPGFIMHGDERETQWARAEQGYGFHLNEIHGGTVDTVGNYTYPGDPMLSPLCTIIEGNEFFFLYHYGIAVFIVMNESGDRTTVKTTRMD